MPKGHYNRQPRQPRQDVSPSTDTDRKMPDAPAISVERLVVPADFTALPSDPEVLPLAELLVPPGFAPPVLALSASEAAAPIQTPAPIFQAPPMLSEGIFSRTVPDVPTTAPIRTLTYEDWMDEDAAGIPADDFVTRKVVDWAGTVCAISHEVTWLPADDSASLEVILTTEHGASVLKAPAGGWTEAGIDAALVKMRVDLRA